MKDWRLVVVNETNKLEVAVVNTSLHIIDKSVAIDFTSHDLSNKSVYFSAPTTYLGKKLTAYGGKLSYTIFYTIGQSGN